MRRRDFAKLKPKGKLLERRIYDLNQIMGTEESGCLTGPGPHAPRVSPTVRTPGTVLDPSLPVGVGIEKGRDERRRAPSWSRERQGEWMLVRGQALRGGGTDGTRQCGGDACGAARAARRFGDGPDA